MTVVRRDLLLKKDFTSHSRIPLQWKLECEALTDTEIETIAWIISQRVVFSSVTGIPKGGLRLAQVLERHSSKRGPHLIVDDVVTTGRAFQKYY